MDELRVHPTATEQVIDVFIEIGIAERTNPRLKAPFEHQALSRGKFYSYLSFDKLCDRTKMAIRQMSYSFRRCEHHRTLGRKRRLQPRLPVFRHLGGSHQLRKIEDDDELVALAPDSG